MQKIKFAVVGYGHIGKKHAEVILDNPQAELLAICDINEAPNSELKNEKVGYFNSIERMLVALPEIDVVNICTPNGLHATHSLLALEHQKHLV